LCQAFQPLLGEDLALGQTKPSRERRCQPLGESTILDGKITTLPERSLLFGKALTFAEKKPFPPRRSFVLVEETIPAAKIES
jgi:hypothetical protein